MPTLSLKTRGMLVGIGILAAYAMLTYTITGKPLLGAITDLIAGLSVIGIAVLMWPIFAPGHRALAQGHRALAQAYLAARLCEGGLMLAGGVFILLPGFESWRNLIYQYVHIWFFVVGALLFYVLLHKTQAVPSFIAIWGGLGALGVLIVAGASLLGIEHPAMIALVAPMILNEVFLAIWLMTKGFAPGAQRP